MRNLIWAAIATVCLIFAIWFIYECVTAPLMDDDGNVIDDPHDRMPKK